MISVLWKKRALPIYWHILSHKGASNLTKQKVVIRLVIKLLKGQKIMITGDRDLPMVEKISDARYIFCFEAKKNQP